MTTEIRFEDEELDVRAYVDEVGAVTVVLRFDDGEERDRSYVSLAGPPAELRRTLARLLGVTNAVAQGLEWMAALDEKDDDEIVAELDDDPPRTGEDVGIFEPDEGPRSSAGVAIMRGDEPR